MFYQIFQKKKVEKSLKGPLQNFLDTPLLEVNKKAFICLMMRNNVRFKTNQLQVVLRIINI